MKNILLIAALAIGALSANAQSMKMVVKNNGQVEGRYLRTIGNQYEVEVQENYTVPMTGHKVVTFSAANGQGIVYRNQDRSGNINVRKGPGTNYPVVAKIVDNVALGYVPDTYPCLGKVNGWYKIRINGKVGYVREDMACWDGMSTF